MSRETQKPVNMSSELSTGKTIVILAVVVGCFAVLWPKVFYPMLTSSVRPSQAPSFRDPVNAHFYKQLCYLLSESGATSNPNTRLSEDKCFKEIRVQCGIELTESSLEAFRLSTDKSDLTHCLNNFHLDAKKIALTAPVASQSRPYKSNSPHPHVRPERPSHLHPETMHPALREKGTTIPHRTIEKQARPGPMPGIRPPMGGGGHMPPPQTKGSGAMGIIMPIYTVGIIIFFIYTIMKVLFKKDSDEDNTPKLKDFHQDPEYKKYVFAEEYLDNSNVTHRQLLRRHEGDSSKLMRRPDPVLADSKIEDEQMDQLRRRLEETETAMERLMSQMGSVTDKLAAAKITEVLTQAQAQARILKFHFQDEEKISSSKASSLEMEDYEPLPKCGDISVDNSTVLRKEGEDEDGLKLCNTSS